MFTFEINSVLLPFVVDLKCSTDLKKNILGLLVQFLLK